MSFPLNISKLSWLVVWLPFFIFPYIGLLIIPIDELIFFRGVALAHQAVSLWVVCVWYPIPSIGNWFLIMFLRWPFAGCNTFSDTNIRLLGIFRHIPIKIPLKHIRSHLEQWTYPISSKWEKTMFFATRPHHVWDLLANCNDETVWSATTLIKLNIDKYIYIYRYILARDRKQCGGAKGYCNIGGDYDDDGDDDDDDNDNDDMRRWRRRRMRMRRRMILRRKTDPKTGRDTLCRPAKSKCTWTFHKSHFVWKFTGKMPDPNPGTSFYASLRSQNAHGHFTRAILCGNLQEKCRTPIRGHRFMRACAVKMHMDISQEPFCVEICRKNAGPQSGDIVLCEPAQSKCTWTFHRSHFVWKFAGKMPDPNPGTSFYASLRSQNAHGHFTRAILCGNLQEKCQTPIRGHRFMRACAVKMHMDISQEPVYVEIYRKNAGRPGDHLD